MGFCNIPICSNPLLLQFFQVKICQKYPFQNLQVFGQLIQKWSTVMVKYQIKIRRNLTKKAISSDKKGEKWSNIAHKSNTTTAYINIKYNFP